MEFTKNKLFDIIKYPILLLTSFVFLLVFSLWTSPLYKDWYGCDASFFTMTGRGIINGWVPYVDFFDLKGPYFFFLQAIGQLLATARTGAFIIQIFALFFSLIFIIKLSRLFLSKKRTLFVIFIFLAGHVATLWGGNTLEEFMLPLSLWSLFLTVSDLRKSSYSNIRWSTALITGISFGIMLFSKITVAAPIVGIVLALIVIFIKNKNYKGLFQYLLIAFLGLIISVTPVFVYFGLHNCISDMLYSVFIFAFKRSIDFGNVPLFNLKWELKISGVYFAIIFSICQMLDTKQLELDIHHINDLIHHKTADITQYKYIKEPDTRTNLYIIVLLMGIITALCLHLGDPFIYYFTTGYPSILFAVILLLNINNEQLILFKSPRYDIPLVIFILSVCYFSSCTASTLNTVIYDRNSTYYSDYVAAAKEMASLIPETDRDKVYSFNIDMQWFECNQILPCYKYQVNLQFFVALDNRIQTNIINYIRKTPPKWLVIGGDLQSYLPNINDIVASKYDIVYANDYGSLYLLQ